MKEDQEQHLIILGGEKCGSTWLQHLFDTNPQFYLYPLEQETDFFSRDYANGINYYEKMFCGKRPGQITVDSCPAYFTKQSAPERIAEYVKTSKKRVRFILSVREPLSRIESAYKMIVRREGFKPFSSEMETGSYIENSLYYKHLLRYLDYFPREDFCLLLYDDIIATPRDVAAQLENFIGLTAESLSLVYEGTRINPGGLRRSRLASGLLRGGGRALRRLGFIKALHRVKRSRLIDWVQRLNTVSYSLPLADREYLESMRVLFDEDVEKIASELDRVEIIERWGYPQVNHP